jgi:hypothetical protein
LKLSASEAWEYLSGVWKLVKRLKEQDFHSLERQDDLEETVEENFIVRDALRKGDVTMFNSQCLHRGPASNGIGYAFFGAWTTPGYIATGLHTDGVPIHKMNWEEEFKQWLDKSRENEKHKGNKFFALANKMTWTKKK